jgi:hypothetical protein
MVPVSTRTKQLPGSARLDNGTLNAHSWGRK